MSWISARIRSLLEEARLGGVDLDATTLEYTLRKTIEKIAERLRENPAISTSFKPCGKLSS